MDNILYQKDFRQLAMRDPNAAAKKLGVPVGANTTVSVKKNTASEIYFVMPDRALIEEHVLDEVSGGGGANRGARARVGIKIIPDHVWKDYYDSIGGNYNWREDKMERLQPVKKPDPTA